MKDLVGKGILVFVKERSRPISGSLVSTGSKYLIVKNGSRNYYIYHRNVLYIMEDEWNGYYSEYVSKGSR